MIDGNPLLFSSSNLNDPIWPCCFCLSEAPQKKTVHSWLPLHKPLRSLVETEHLASHGSPVGLAKFGCGEPEFLSCLQSRSQSLKWVDIADASKGPMDASSAYMLLTPCTLLQCDSLHSVASHCWPPEWRSAPVTWLLNPFGSRRRKRGSQLR